MKFTEWRRGCHSCVLLGLLGAVLMVPNTARAELPRYRVELHAPKYLPNCAVLEDFHVELDLVLNHTLLGSPATHVLNVRIEQPPGGAYAVDVIVADVDGHVLSKQSQTYSGAMECFKVLHKVAFVAAMEMERDIPDESAKRVELATQPPTSLACPTPPALPATPPRCPEPAVTNPASPPLPPRKRGFVGLGVGAFLNVAPEAFFAPYVRVGWYVRPRVALELDFTGQAWTTTRPQDGPTIIDVKTVLPTIAGCYVMGTFMICGLFATEVRHSSSSGRARFVPQTDVFPILGARASLDHQLVRSLSVRANVDVLFYPLERQIDGRSDTLWEPIPLATNLTTSLVWTF